MQRPNEVPIDERAPHATGPTTILISPRAAVVLAVALGVALVLLVRAAPGILSVLLGGAVLALVLSFPVRLLSQRLPRGVAIAVAVGGLLVLLIVALVVLIPLLIRELGELVRAAPRLATEAEVAARQFLGPLRERGLLPADPRELIDRVQQELLNRAQMVGQALLAGIVGMVGGAVGTFFQLFGTLFIGIYLLADIRRFKAAYLQTTPKRYRQDARALWEELGHALSRYLGGLLVSLAIQGVLAVIFLSVLGVPYAFVLGLWTAATGVLPYIGAWLGAIPAVTLALFISPGTAALTALAYLGINQLEGNILTPRIQGEAVRVHPLLVFVAVLAGGEMAGLAGAALAVPTVAVLRVLAGFFSARLRIRR